VIGYLRDHRDLGASAREDDRVDPIHVGRDELAQSVDGSAVMRFEGNDNSQGQLRCRRDGRE